MIVSTNTHIETPSCFRRIRLYDLSIPPMTKSCSNRVSCVDIIDDPCHRHSFELALSSPSTIGNLFLLFLYFSNSLFNSVSRFVLFHKGMGKIHPHPRISSMTPGLDRGEGKLATDQVGEDWKRIIIDHSQIIDCARTSQWYSVYQHFLDGTFLHDKPTISRGAIAGWQSQVGSHRWFTVYCVLRSVYCSVCVTETARSKGHALSSSDEVIEGPFGRPHTGKSALRGFFGAFPFPFWINSILFYLILFSFSSPFPSPLPIHTA